MRFEIGLRKVGTKKILNPLLQVNANIGLLTPGWVHCMCFHLCFFPWFRSNRNSICLLGVVWYGHNDNDGGPATGGDSVNFEFCIPFSLKWMLLILLQFLCLLQAARGVGSILGPILVGKLFDMTGSYAFGNIAGCICLSCGAICMVVVMSLHSRQLTKSLLI